MSAVARNAYCPCGSCKRFKDCHGRTDPAQSRIVQNLMSDALTFQVNGYTLRAAELYARVLSEDPTNFDATHMLGVVQYQRGNFNDAVVLLKRARKLKPEITTVRHNLTLVESIFANELELCRDALSHAASLVKPIHNIDQVLLQAQRSHVIIAEEFAKEDVATLERIVKVVPSDRIILWATPTTRIRSPHLRVLDTAPQSHPAGGLMIFVGTRHASVAWVEVSQPQRVVLVVTRDDPGALLDAIRCLSLEGRTTIGLAYATTELAERLRFPKGSRHIGLDHGENEVALQYARV